MDVWRSVNRMEKIALVTGSTRGIGKAIAQKLLSKGYVVYLHYCINEEIALSTYNELLKQKMKVKLISSNLADEEEIKDMFEKIKLESGHLDVLVNNAASGVHKDIEKVRKKDWDYTFQVNSRGTFFCSKYAIPLMTVESPHYKAIVNIISTGSMRFVPGYSLIGGTKASIENLTKYLACEVAKYGMTDECGLIVNSSRGIIHASNGKDFATVAATKAQEIQQQMATLLTAKGIL